MQSLSPIRDQSRKPKCCRERPGGFGESKVCAKSRHGFVYSGLDFQNQARKGLATSTQKKPSKVILHSWTCHQLETCRDWKIGAHNSWVKACIIPVSLLTPTQCSQTLDPQTNTNKLSVVCPHAEALQKTMSTSPASETTRSDSKTVPNCPSGTTREQCRRSID